MTAYQRLEEIYRRLMTLRDIESLLHWDMSTMMPKGGAEARSAQMALVRVMAHERLTAPEVGHLLDAADADGGLDPWQAANLAEMRREWLHATAVDAALVEAYSKAVSACEVQWRAARPAADFASVRPHLARVLALTREIAHAKAERLGCSPHEALLDQFEPGLRTAELDRLFAPLESFLPGFLPAVIDRQRDRGPALPLEGPFPIPAQRALALKLMARLGFDFERGRLDTSLHPFCSGSDGDVRLTTRYDEVNFIKAMMGVLHETGHALYEQGLPAAWQGQPVSRVHSMGLHESQSLLLEMQVCRSREFLEFAAPLMAQAFSGRGPAWEPENLHRQVTQVAPGPIRVDADEVTYPAHVFLRYRLERAMIAGDLAVADLPAAWNEGMERLLGLVPAHDGEGCLQDIHWFDGAWGYFPSYTLGALAAAQLFAAACAADATIRPGIARGDFAPLLAWLRAKVHGQGSRLGLSALIREATGAPLDSAAFRRHLEARYLT